MIPTTNQAHLMPLYLMSEIIFACVTPIADSACMLTLEARGAESAFLSQPPSVPTAPPCLCSHTSMLLRQGK